MIPKSIPPKHKNIMKRSVKQIESTETSQIGPGSAKWSKRRSRSVGGVCDLPPKGSHSVSKKRRATVSGGRWSHTLEAWMPSESIHVLGQGTLHRSGPQRWIGPRLLTSGCAVPACRGVWPSSCWLLAVLFQLVYIYICMITQFRLEHWDRNFNVKMLRS